MGVMIETLTKNIRNSLKLIGLAALISAVSLWFFSTDYPTMIKNRYFTGSIENYMNVSIGDKREDVLYKLGRPISVLGDPGKCNDNQPWSCLRRVYFTGETSDKINKIDKDIKFFNVYNYPDNSNSSDSFSIYFDTKNQVKTMDCTGKCDAILGITISSDERDLIRLLGNPSSSKINAGSGIKTVTYKKFNLTFYLEKMKVYMIVVGPDDR
jgi:hypothetical protein